MSGRLGYRYDLENRDLIATNGVEPHRLMATFREQFPQTNVNADPATLVSILNQGNQGACQGHSLAMVLSICFFLQTGRYQNFSRAAGYYLSQRYDGIRGDQGSTLSAGQKVVTQHGMCLESDWPYPNRYDPTEPAGISYPYKLAATKEFRDFDQAMEWLELGLPIQTGITWGDEMDREVVSSFSGRGGGGHSTTLWLLRPNGNIPNINSWGSWMQDGIHEWTPNAFRQMFNHRWSVFIGYAPDNMLFPDPKPIG